MKIVDREFAMRLRPRTSSFPYNRAVWHGPMIGFAGMLLAVFLYGAIDSGIHDRVAYGSPNGMASVGSASVIGIVPADPVPTAFPVLVAHAGGGLSVAIGWCGWLGSTRLRGERECPDC